MSPRTADQGVERQSSAEQNVTSFFMPILSSITSGIYTSQSAAFTTVQPYPTSLQIIIRRQEEATQPPVGWYWTERRYIFLRSRPPISPPSINPAPLSMDLSASQVYLPQQNTNLQNLGPFAHPPIIYATTYTGNTPGSVCFLSNLQPQATFPLQSSKTTVFQTSFNEPQPHVGVDAYQSSTLRTVMRHVSSSSAGPANKNETEVRPLHQERSVEEAKDARR